MKYTHYITKKRMRADGICGRVNIPSGTILPVVGDFITYKGEQLCAIGSQNAIDYFSGYDPSEPQGKKERG